MSVIPRKAILCDKGLPSMAANTFRISKGLAFINYDSLAHRRFIKAKMCDRSAALSKLVCVVLVGAWQSELQSGWQDVAREPFANEKNIRFVSHGAWGGSPE